MNIEKSKLNLCRTYWYITRRKNHILLNIASVASTCNNQKTYKKYTYSPNINKVPKFKYIPNVSTTPNPNKGIINNINIQSRKNIRGMTVAARKTNNTNMLRLTQNLYTIAKTKKKKQRNITSMKHLCIQTSNKN